MQHPLDGDFTVELQVISDCDCEAHGLVIQHAATCKRIRERTDRDQVRDLARGFIEMYDSLIEQGKRRRRITPSGRAIARQAVRFADFVLGTEHRYT